MILRAYHLSNITFVVITTTCLLASSTLSSASRPRAPSCWQGDPALELRPSIFTLPGWGPRFTGELGPLCALIVQVWEVPSLQVFTSATVRLAVLIQICSYQSVHRQAVELLYSVKVPFFLSFFSRNLSWDIWGPHEGGRLSAAMNVLQQTHTHTHTHTYLHAHIYLSAHMSLPSKYVIWAVFNTHTQTHTHTHTQLGTQGIHDCSCMVAHFR